MDGWVMQVGGMLLPEVERMRLDLLSGSYIQADQTMVDMQVGNGSCSNHQAYLW